MRPPIERVDQIRRRSTERENHLIDEYRGRKIGRREFVRRAATAGMALPVVGFVASACGLAGEPGQEQATPQTAPPKPGGTLRVGQEVPIGLDPTTVNTMSGLSVLGHAAEFLIWTDPDLTLRPRLAESWSVNDAGDVWTFNIRRGVTFHDGTEMTAHDVVATIDHLADPGVGSNAMSAFQGVLSVGGTRAIDDYTVEFTLETANGNFPYAVSSDNYNTIILPQGYDTTNWTQDFMGTGPWRLQSYRPNEGVTLVPNEQYWDRSRIPILDQLELVFFSSEQGLVLAFQGNQVDFAQQYSVSGGKALLSDPTIVTTELLSAAHRQVHIRTDGGPNGDLPTRDKRVRRAMALLVNRHALVDGLLDDKAVAGNDSPFAPVYPSTSPDVAQRERDVAEARRLLEAAGVGDGFSLRLETWNGFEMPDLAQLLQQDLRAGGVNLDLRITDQGSYFGDATYGNSRWLDSNMGITEYGHRGVPDVMLSAPLRSDGIWNGAHFDNPEYDNLVDSYTAAVDLDEQRDAAKAIQELLLDESPILFTYFYDFLSGAKDYVSGIEVTATGHVDATQAGHV